MHVAREKMIDDGEVGMHGAWWVEFMLVRSSRRGRLLGTADPPP